jgi:tetratricopeptide (TPR) repeat protein
MQAVLENASRASALVRTSLRCSARGDYRLAEQYLRKALKFAPKGKRLSRTSRPLLWNELGMVCKYLGKFDRAGDYYRRALRDARRSRHSADRTFFLADLYHNFGGVEHSRGRFSRAEKYARKGLELRLKCAAANSLAVAADRVALAAILDGLQRHTESEILYRAALRVYRRKYGASGRENAVILNNLGALCQATGRAKRAEFYYRAALRIKRMHVGECHPDVAVTVNNLAMLERSQGRLKHASSLFERALEILQNSLGRSHPNTLAVRRNRQEVWEVSGRRL